MLNGVLTRWELTPDKKFQVFYRELSAYLRRKLIFSPLPNGEEYWSCDFNHTDYYDCNLPDVDAFKHARCFCEERRLCWPEVKEMIDEYKNDWLLCDCEIVNDIPFI